MAEPAEGEKEVQILRPEAGNRLTLDISSLERILLADDVKDKPVVVVSVAGAYRKGKSFLLGFFLRYMRDYNKTNWLQDSNAPLKGFTWSGGSKAKTMGILLWSRVFLVNTPKHGEVAVIFVDTQGSFDPRSTLQDCAFIFALSALISSVQVYNISRDLEMHHLHHLELFAEYGRLAQRAGTKGKPFQKLLFLVRDWSNAFEKPYGAFGGGQYLDEFLEEGKGNREVQTFQKETRSLFTDVGCFLMPYPGSKLSNTPSFNGRLSDMEKDFVTHLGNLVPSLLAPENLLVKEINGKAITCQQLVEYIKAYVGVFNGGTMPRAATVLEATSKVTNIEAVNAALEEYKDVMELLWKKNEEHVSLPTLKNDHSQARRAALEMFDKVKMGGGDLAKEYERKIAKGIDDWFEEFLTIKEDEAAKAEAANQPLLTPTSSLWSLLPIAGPFVLLGLAIEDSKRASNAHSQREELAQERERVKRRHDLFKQTN